MAMDEPCYNYRWLVIIDNDISFTNNEEEVKNALDAGFEVIDLKHHCFYDTGELINIII